MAEAKTAGLDATQLYERVIVPTLEELGLFSEAAAQLVLGTGLQESRLRWIKQLGKGPALGIYQCEPATHQDYWDHYLKYHDDLTDRIMAWGGTFDAERLVYDLRYATAMCRIHYRRIRAPLPAAGDVDRQAQYWKRYYNSHLGAGEPKHYVAAVGTYGPDAIFGRA